MSDSTSKTIDYRPYFVVAFRLTITLGLIAGIILIIISGTIIEVSTRDFLKQLGILLLGAFGASLINEIVLGNYYKQQNKDLLLNTIGPSLDEVKISLCESIDHIVPDIQRQTNTAVSELSEKIQIDTNNTLEMIREKVTNATDVMVNGIDVLSGAKAAGIVNIFPRRYKNMPGLDLDRRDNSYYSVMDLIASDMSSETAFINLMGISLGDYFLDRGSLHQPLMEILSGINDLRVKALIVHPKSDALGERARWEANATDNNDFFVSTTFIETDGSARIAKKLCQDHKKMEVRLYNQAPTAFVLLTSRFAFFEPYTYAARGSTVPVFQVQASSRLYKEYLSHFMNIWNISLPIDQYDPLKDMKGPFDH